jgi:hypothetical protein
LESMGELVERVREWSYSIIIKASSINNITR